jgi:cytochrome c oxidase cbb3-type subunit 4
MNLTDQTMDVIRGVLMVGLIIAFIGMWVWAWSSKRKRAFHDASMLPLEEDNGQIPQPDNGRANSKKDRIED